MKYYSEKLDKLFSDEKELKRAELQLELKEEAEKKELAKKEAEEKEKNALVSKEKKELSKAIEQAENDLQQAYADYDIAKEEVQKLYNEYNKKALEILNPAKEVIEKAEKNRFEAISNFNKKYGVYTTTYSGDKAYQELKRSISWANDIFNHFFF